MPLLPLTSTYLPQKVSFFFKGVRPSLANRTVLKKYIQTILKMEGKKPGSISYIFCNDKTLLDINRKWLGHDFYTDILTFDLSDSGSIQAEIYISIDRVKDNAGKLRVSLRSELHRVIFHGVLHLCGYKDKSRVEREKMRKKEDLLLNQYFR